MTSSLISISALCYLLVLVFTKNVLTKQRWPFADITDDALVEGPGEQCCSLTRDIVNELTGNFFSYVLSMREASLAENEK